MIIESSSNNARTIAIYSNNFLTIDCRVFCCDKNIRFMQLRQACLDS